MRKWSLLLLLPLMGCASTSNDVDFKKVKPKQRVYMGKIDVTLNGEKPEKCELFMNSKLAPNLKLSDDGYVIYKTSDRKPFIGKVRCLHVVSSRKSAWHTQKLELQPLVRPKKRKSVNYFGHLKLDWTIDPDATVQAQPQDPSAFKQVGLVDGSGSLSVQVEDKSTEAQEYMKKKWAVLKDFRVETNLVTSMTANEDEELDEDEEE